MANVSSTKAGLFFISSATTSPGRMPRAASQPAAVSMRR